MSRPCLAALCLAASRLACKPERPTPKLTGAVEHPVQRELGVVALRNMRSRCRFNTHHFPWSDPIENLEHLRHEGMEHGVRVPSGRKNENRDGQSTEVLLIGEVLINGDQHLILPSSRPQQWTVLQTSQPGLFDRGDRVAHKIAPEPPCDTFIEQHAHNRRAAFLLRLPALLGPVHARQWGIDQETHPGFHHSPSSRTNSGWALVSPKILESRRVSRGHTQ
jgi:hypothetical protein